MQRAHKVRGFQCTGQFHADAHRLAPIEGSVPSDQRFQRILGVVWHHDERPATGSGADLQNRHDVRVSGQPAHRTLLTQKSIEIVRVEVGGQNLDRDSAIQFRLRAAIDDPKAAAPDFLDESNPALRSSPAIPEPRFCCVACGSPSAIDDHHPH